MALDNYIMALDDNKFVQTCSGHLVRLNKFSAAVTHLFTCSVIFYIYCNCLACYIENNLIVLDKIECRPSCHDAHIINNSKSTSFS